MLTAAVAAGAAVLMGLWSAPLARAASRDFVCYNHVVFHSPDWSSPAYRSALRRLAPGRLRIPGGTLADFWDWSIGGVVAEADWPSGHRPPYSYEARSARGLTLARVDRSLEGSGVGAIFGLNVFSVSLESELDELRKAAATGLKVDRIQIGNEPYFAEPYMTARFPEPADFAAYARTTAERIRADFPEARIAVPGVVMTREREAQPRLADWNAALIEAGVFEIADAVSIHPYIGSNLGAIDTAPNELTPAHAAQVARWGLRPDAYFLSQPWLGELPPGARIWITEFNYFEPAGRERVSGAWLQGLVNLARMMRWLDDPRIAHACLHQLVGHHAWQALASADGGAMTYDGQGRPAAAWDAEPFALAASGAALARLSAALGEGETAVSPDPADDAAAPVVARRFARHDGGWRVLIVNLSDQAHDVTESLAGAAAAEIVSADPWGAVYDPRHLTVRRQTVHSRSVIAPPFSIVLGSSAVSDS